MASIRGFAEWLPEQELVQQQIIATVRDAYELHGFTPLQTRSIEDLADLLSQGDTDKEIYGVARLQSGSGAAKWGLHYDLTVPFARFVGQNRSKLRFPFRRYQIQPAWRGERPQLGRFREFIQADADVIDDGQLDLRHDADMLVLLRRATENLPTPPIRLLINNRKVLQGFYTGLGVTDIVGALRAVDKLPKLGRDGVADALGRLGLAPPEVTACLALAGIEASSSDELDQVRDLGVTSTLLETGLDELGQVLDAVQEAGGHGRAVVALHIARGFDYYTGTVVEGVLEGHEDLGSVCSGGRYDDLASGAGQPLPGVGVSIGISRLMAFLSHLDLLETSRRTPAKVMVAVISEDRRRQSDRLADRLRKRGISTLVSDSSQEFGKQIRAASSLGVRYMWFPAEDGVGDGEVRDLEAGEQTPASADDWVISSS